MKWVIQLLVQGIHKRIVQFQKLTRNLFLTLELLVALEKLGTLPLLTVYAVPM
jgi:hypothetical protein